MKRLRLACQLLLAIPLAGCVTTAARPVQPPATATAAETEFLCAVLPAYIERLGDYGESAVPIDYARVPAIVGQIRMSAAARLPSCPPGTPPIFWSWHYVDGFGLNAEGTLGMISGGWQISSLNGAGGACFFERTAAGWTLLGCVLSGIS